MEIEFVNHSSFVLSHDGVRVICDPWIEGYAFNNGWSLLAETSFGYDDFKGITHIWFSHEHPDHFVPPNLFKIPKEIRENITVLFQETTDQKVYEFCGKLNFQDVVELKQGIEYKLSEKILILCNAYSHGDSYALFKSEELTILNLNDCIVDSQEKAAELQREVGCVDILFTQFGYANKIGNSSDLFQRKEESKKQLEQIKFQNIHLQPKKIIPFASFIYFCHEENRYMNEGMNTVHKANQYISELSAECVVLYPGDVWKVDAHWDNREPLEKWSQRYEMDKRDYIKSVSVSIEQLEEQASLFADKMNIAYEKNKRELHKLKTIIYITDYGKSFEYTIKNRLIECAKKEVECDISLNSESLHYVFKELWGGNTLFINARFQIPKGGDYSRFRKFEGMAASLNHGKEFVFESDWLRLKSFIKKRMNMVKRK